jgi:hypothetical protein
MASFQLYSSASGAFVELAFVAAASELDRKYVLVDPTHFIAEYLPNHPNRPDIDYEAFKQVTHKKPVPRNSLGHRERRRSTYTNQWCVHCLLQL